MSLDTDRTDPAATLRGGAPAAAPGVDEEGWVGSRPPRAVEVVQRILRFPALVIEHRDLIVTSTRRDLEARFTGTILGWIWPLVHPLFLFAVYYFIFTKLLSFKIPELPPGHEAALGVYMFCGIMAWAAVNESLMRGTSCIVDNGNLIKKLAFPSETLPLNVTLVGLVTHGFALVIFVLATVLTPIWAAPGWGLAWVPVLLLVQGLFTYGLALLLSTLQVFLRDTLQLVGILLTVWMFLTPLFWVPELMPNIDAYMPLIRANPVYHLVMAWRGVLMGDVVTPPLPGREELGPLTVVSVDAVAGHVGVFALWAVGAFVLGYTLLVLSQRRFADEV